MKTRSLRFLCAGFVATILVFVGAAADRDVKPSAKPAIYGPSAAQLKKMRAGAVRFLSSTQGDDGSWTSPAAPGITALVTTALLKSGASPDDPVVAKALKHLQTYVQADGGIYHPKSNHRNYETCICILAFKEANKDRRHDKLLARAGSFIKKLQWDETEGRDKSDLFFGGAGYGNHERPDMSNTQFLVEALKATGTKSDDPAMKNALLFISRCQNLESAHNTTKFAPIIDDGGFFYTIAAGGSSQAGVTAEGGLRSYGSMTYAGLKSMIYAGVGPDDPRVKAAFTWIRKFYSVKHNPGLGQQGVYYYYHTFAKALTAMKQDFVEDTGGIKHDWRKELTEHLAARQKKNGSWVNPASRWYEGDPNLVTAYSLLALSYCEPAAPREASR